jgi:tetratricopeptide (TPR) repeat protein
MLSAEPAAAGKLEKDLEQAQELLDAGQPIQVLHLLEPWTQVQKPSPKALLLSSTARFMTGDVDRGRLQLEQSLAADPTLRQGWLNLGALHVADEAWDAALQAFEKAEKLDPAADDNHLNIGAVRLLRGELEPAADRFQRYLQKQATKGSEAAAEAQYLVASNYAVAGYTRLTVEHLAQCFRLQERYRLRARTDSTFDPLRSERLFQQLLERDLYAPPQGTLSARETFDTAYDATDGRLLGAVIDALQEAGITFESRVEVAPSWALIWGDWRIKVTNAAEGGGLVEITAHPEGWTEERWRQRTQSLFQHIATQLTR